MKEKKRKGAWGRTILFLILLVCLLIIVLLQSRQLRASQETGNNIGESARFSQTAEPKVVDAVQDAESDEESEDGEAEETPVQTLSLPEFSPHATADSEPSDVIYSESISVHGNSADSYIADEDHAIDFGLGRAYTQVNGIVTFRGNNFRSSSQFGSAYMRLRSFGDYWTQSTEGMSDNNGNYWGGSGWTGQPLVMEWSAEVKQNMNMYDWAREKDGLVEVIYATLGGYVYFQDLETGEPTRDPLYLGYTFKGAGSLDPRGYPILYVGGGVVNDSGNSPRIMVVSLLDGSVLYETGYGDSFAPRGWTAYDSSPLVDAETDQLIYPGENGVLYIIDLNTEYDEELGTISVEPETVKFTYRSDRCDEHQGYYGMEDSAIIWRNYLMIADNGGDYLCIDLNDLHIVWQFDCLDDTNCTAVLELDETGHPYVYLSTSFHYGWRGTSTATIPIWKIDAETGEEVWHHDYTCYTVEDLSGGVQGSLALGTGSLDGILYVAVARTPDSSNGELVALDTETGDEIWTYTSGSYSWASPVAFYDTEGNGYVLYISALDGVMYLFDGLTGDVLDTFTFGVTTEASPVVYNNTVVVGTRGQQIYGITLE